MDWTTSEYDEIFETASCIEVVPDDQQFLPNLRTISSFSKSLDDIDCYQRYYDHLDWEFQKCDRHFSYDDDFMGILRQRILSYDIRLPEIKEKPIGIVGRFLKRFPSMSSPPSELVSSSEELRRSEKKTKASKRHGKIQSKSNVVKSGKEVKKFVERSPPISELSPKTQSSLLKKVYEETRNYAQKICKTIERVGNVHYDDSIDSPICSCSHVTGKSSDIIDSRSSKQSFSPVTTRCRRLEKAKLASGEVPRKYGSPMMSPLVDKCSKKERYKKPEFMGDSEILVRHDVVKKKSKIKVKP